MAHFVAHSAYDVDEQAQALDGWCQYYEQLSAGRFQGDAWQLVMDEGTLLREHTNRHLREQITPPPDHLVLAVPLAVQPGSVFAGRPLERESLLVFGPDEEHELVAAGELDLIGMVVHRDLVAGLAPLKQEWLAQAQRERNLGLSPDCASAVRHTLLALSTSLDGEQREDTLDRLSQRGASAELLSATLTQTVLLAMQCNGQPSSIAIPRRAEARLKVVKRAIAFMRDRLHDDIGVADICAAAFASRRSLQYCFEEHLRTTPQAYLRALRLNEARRSLKRSGERSITDLANALCFASHSHFTRHYKRMFDELPSDTLRAVQPGGLGSRQ